MLIFAPKEAKPEESRAPLVPDTVRRLVKLGAEVIVEAGIGDGPGYADDAYAEAGATVVQDRDEHLAKADVVLRPVSYTHLRAHET